MFFSNIRDDEAEHVATMVACQDPTSAIDRKNVETALVTTALVGSAVLALVGGGEITETITAVTEAADSIEDGVDGVVLSEELGGLGAVAALAKQAFTDTLEGGEVNLMKERFAELLELLKKGFGVFEP